MKVKELIAKLLKFDPDAEVEVYNGEYGRNEEPFVESFNNGHVLIS